MSANKNNVDIFDVLEHIDSFDINYYNSLTPEQQKSIPPYTIMMWLSGCKSPLQIRMINVFLNSTTFVLPIIHAGLLYKLACISSDGKKKKYQWLKSKGKNKKYANAVKVLRTYYKCSSKVALDYVNLLDYDDVASLAMELGEQDDILRKIKKEMK